MAERDTQTPLIHLYRGELGRMTMYRVRLDTTTNWAVGTSAAVISFVLGSPDAPHYVLGLAILLDFAFLHLEARRYQRFAVIRRRVDLLERGFYCDILGQEAIEGWQETLRRHLLDPPHELSWYEAIAARMRRNYLWVFLAVGIAWVLAIDLEHLPLEEAAAVGRVSGRVVAAVVACTGVFLFGWALAGKERRNSPE